MLFLPFTSSLRLEGAVERAVGAARLAVPSSVLAELHRLEARGVANARAAAELAGRFPVSPTERRGDAGVRDAARRSAAWVFTSDRALARTLRSEGIPVLFPRGRSGLVAFPGSRRQTVKNDRSVVRARTARRGNDDRRRPIAGHSEPRVRQRRRRGL